MATLDDFRSGFADIIRPKPRARVGQSEALCAFVTKANARPDAIPDKLVDMFRMANKRSKS
jgi:hypothetical protein